MIGPLGACPCKRRGGGGGGGGGGGLGGVAINALAFNF